MRPFSIKEIPSFKSRLLESDEKERGERMAKVGVLLANTGSPDAPTPEAVSAYLSEFLTDEHIMPMNPHVWKLILHAFILPARSKKSAAKYALIWTDKGSPLTVTMGSLARKLEEELLSRGFEVVVKSCASYGSPSIEDALQTCVNEGCDKVLVVPLYPQSAYSTTCVVEDRARATMGALQMMDASSSLACSLPTLHVAPPYYTNPLYISALVQCVQDAGFGTQPGDKLLFAFHSVPRCDLDAGDTYDKQVKETIRAVVDKLGLVEDDWALGFQCRFDKRRTWLNPFVSEAITTLESKNPIGRLFVIAPNFSIDCLETFYDIEIELREQFCTHHSGEFIYIPCLNDSQAQVALLADEVSAALGA